MSKVEELNHCCKIVETHACDMEPPRTAPLRSNITRAIVALLCLSALCFIFWFDTSQPKIINDREDRLSQRFKTPRTIRFDVINGSLSLVEGREYARTTKSSVSEAKSRFIRSEQHLLIPETTR
jgi:hypothetical protein